MEVKVFPYTSAVVHKFSRPELAKEIEWVFTPCLSRLMDMITEDLVNIDLKGDKLLRVELKVIVSDFNDTTESIEQKND